MKRLQLRINIHKHTLAQTQAQKVEEKQGLWKLFHSTVLFVLGLCDAAPECSTHVASGDVCLWGHEVLYLWTDVSLLKKNKTKQKNQKLGLWKRNETLTLRIYPMRITSFVRSKNNPTLCRKLSETSPPTKAFHSFLLFPTVIDSLQILMLIFNSV